MPLPACATNSQRRLYAHEAMNLTRPALIALLFFLCAPILRVDSAASLATCPSSSFGGGRQAGHARCSCSLGQFGLSFHCRRLTDRDLSEMLTSIDLSAVVSLRIADSRLSELPPMRLMRSALKTFACVNCGLTSESLACDQFEGFRQLTTIDLSGNRLGSICPEFFSIALAGRRAQQRRRKRQTNNEDQGDEVAQTLAAEEDEVRIRLILRNAALTSIPADLFGDNCVNVYAIDLSGNPTGLLPSGLFGKCRNLKVIGLSRMRLDEYSPDWFVDPVTPKKGPKLRVLKLNGNRLQSFRSGDLNAFTKSLEELDLSRNLLTRLPTPFVSNFKMLERLDLSHNRLKRIDQTLLDGGENMREFSVAHNPLRTVPTKLFESNKKIRRISFAGIAARSIRPELFDESKQIEKIDFTGSDIPRSLQETLVDMTGAVSGRVRIRINIES